MGDGRLGDQASGARFDDFAVISRALDASEIAGLGRPCPGVPVVIAAHGGHHDAGDSARGPTSTSPGRP